MQEISEGVEMEQQQQGNITLEYDSIASGEAVRRLLKEGGKKEEKVDFIVIDAPIDSLFLNRSGFAERNHSVLQVPYVVGALKVVVNVPELVQQKQQQPQLQPGAGAGGGVAGQQAQQEQEQSEIKLSACNLARIFSVSRPCSSSRRPSAWVHDYGNLHKFSRLGIGMPPPASPAHTRHCGLEMTTVTVATI